MSYETDRIEADISESRHRLNDTIEALGHKLSPGQIVDEVLGLAQGQAGHFAANLGRQVRDNPLPAVLIGAGLVALMMNNNARTEHSDYDDRHWRAIDEARWRTARLAHETQEAFEARLHDAYAKALDLRHEAGEAMDAFKSRVSRAVSSIDHAAHRAGRKIAHAFSDAKHFAQDQARHAGESAAHARHAAMTFYADNPLAAGAIAVAIGALVGAAAPLTEMERDALDGAADRAAGAGAKLAERGADLAERAASRVTDSMH